MVHVGRIALAALIGLVAAAPAAVAQQFPTKPVKIVVPYPPGGATDIVVRLYAPGVGEALGQPVIVENKAGAGTNLAGETVARSAPDGYTLYVASFASHSVNRWLYKKMPYDPAKDMVGVAMISRSPMFLCVKPGSPFKTAGEIVAYGKANPGKLTYGSTGNGSPNHISGALLAHLGKFEAVHVPYKGSAELQADILAGQIDYGFDGAIIAHHRSGKLKCIATGSAAPWPTDPEFPPVGKDVPGFDMSAYFGITAPAGTPADVIEKLNAAFLKVAKTPELAEKLKVTSATPFPTTVKEAQDFLSKELVRWESVVKASGASVD